MLFCDFNVWFHFIIFKRLNDNYLLDWVESSSRIALLLLYSSEEIWPFANRSLRTSNGDNLRLLWPGISYGVANIQMSKNTQMNHQKRCIPQIWVSYTMTLVLKIVSESYHILLYKCLAWRNFNVIKFRIDFAGFFEDLLLSRAGCPHMTVL